MSPSCGVTRLLIIQLIFCSIPALSKLIAVDLIPIGPSPEHLERGGEVEDPFRPTTNTSLYYFDTANQDAVHNYTFSHDTHSYVQLDRLYPKLNGSRVVFNDVNTDVAFRTDLCLQFNDVEDYKAATTAWAASITDLIFLVTDEFAFEGLGDRSVYRAKSLEFREMDRVMIIHAEPEPSDWQSIAHRRSSHATTLEIRIGPVPEGYRAHPRSEDEKEMLNKRLSSSGEHIFNFGDKTWDPVETILKYK
ncbi:hypothetical protein LTS10_001264 [Elasticomyces elasticus]|nr:hypothetical protein LTS10_001264 [Elasticomyces elasticus]